MVKLTTALNLKARPGTVVQLSAKGTNDPDGNGLVYKWWQYQEAGTFAGTVEIKDAGAQDASFAVPADDKPEQTIHVICEVTDNGSPPLTRYQRVVVEIE